VICVRMFLINYKLRGFGFCSKEKKNRKCIRSFPVSKKKVGQIKEKFFRMCVRSTREFKVRHNLPKLFKAGRVVFPG
jgi:hypothetical protein